MGMPEDFRVPIPLLQSIINTGINLLRFSKELPGDQTTRFPMGCEPDGSHRKEGFHTDEVTAASQWWWNVLTIHDGVSGCYNPFLFFTFLNRGAYWLFKQILAQLNVMLFKIVSSICFVFMNHKPRVDGGSGWLLLEQNFIMERHGCSPSDEFLNWTICKVKLNCVLCLPWQSTPVEGPSCSQTVRGLQKGKLQQALSSSFLNQNQGISFIQGMSLQERNP